MQVVRFPLDEQGGEVWIEVDDGAGRGFRPAARDGLAEKARASFQQALQSLRPAVRTIIDTLADLAPDEMEISLGIKFTADARAIIAATGTEATIGVKATWKPQAPPEK